MASSESTSGTEAGNQVVGKVVILYGSVKAISLDGTERVLAPNSPIFAYDRIVTESDGRVSIILDDPAQSQLDIGRMTHIVIDDDIFAGVTPEDVAAAAAEVEQIQEALLAEGFDPTVELEAPAAGGSAAAGGGHPVPDFVRVTHEGNVTSGAPTIGTEGDTVETIPGSAEPPDPTITVAINAEGGLVPEGVDAVFTVTVTDATDGAQLHLGLSDGTANGISDYNLTTFQYDSGSGWQDINGPITLAAGTNSLLVRTDTVADNVDEPDENFSLSAEVVNENGASASDSAEAIIVDGDIPTVTVSDDIRVEGETEIFTVNVTKAADGAELTLNLTDGTAESPADYNAKTFEYSTDDGDTWQNVGGPITLTEGSHEILVRTDTAVDDLLEGDENFFLNAELTNAGGDPVEDAGEGIIVEGTPEPEPEPEPGPEPEPVTLNISDDRIPEGVNGVFTVTIGNAPGGAQLELDLNEGTADDPADYHAVRFEYNDGSGWKTVNGPIDIPAGDSSLQVRTDTVNDTIDENNETFFVNGSISAAGGVIVSDTGTGIILDDDVPPPPQPQNFSQTINIVEGQTIPVTVNTGGQTIPDGPYTGSLGSVTVTGNTFNYIAPARDHGNDGSDSDGPDSAIFTFNLPNGGTSTITLNILDTVPDAVDDGPIAVAEDTSQLIDVRGNDSDSEDTPSSWSLLSGAGNGNVTDHGNGTFTYTPDAGFAGTDSFTYTITDDDGDTDTATVTVNVASDSEPFVSVTDGEVDESALRTAAETTDSGTLTVDVGNDVPPTVQVQAANGTWVTIGTGGDTDVDGEYGTLTVTESSGSYSWEYTLDTAQEHTKPANDTTLTDDFAVRVIDSEGDSTEDDGIQASETISVDITDDVPSIGAPEDVALANEIGSSETGDLDIQFGADGPSSGTPIQLTGTVNGSGFAIDNGGNPLTSTINDVIHNIEYLPDGNGGLVAVHADDSSYTVFTVTVNESDADGTGEYTVNLVGQLDGGPVTTSIGLHSGDHTGGIGTNPTFTEGDITISALGAVGGDPNDLGVDNVNYNANGIGVDTDAKVNGASDDLLQLEFYDSSDGTTLLKFTTLDIGMESATFKSGDIAYIQAYVTDEFGVKTTVGSSITFDYDVEGLSKTITPGGEFDTIRVTASPDSEFRVSSLSITEVTEAVDHTVNFDMVATDGDLDFTDPGDSFDVTFDGDGVLDSLVADPDPEA